VAGDDALHLGRIHVLAAGDNHVLEPVVQVEEAVRVEGSAVAGAQPAAGEHHLGGLFGLTPVAFHDAGAGHQDLAGGQAVIDRGEDRPALGRTVQDLHELRAAGADAGDAAAGAHSPGLQRPDDLAGSPV